MFCVTYLHYLEDNEFDSFGVFSAALQDRNMPIKKRRLHLVGTTAQASPNQSVCSQCGSVTPLDLSKPLPNQTEFQEAHGSFISPPEGYIPYGHGLGTQPAETTCIDSYGNRYDSSRGLRNDRGDGRPLDLTALTACVRRGIQRGIRATSIDGSSGYCSLPSPPSSNHNAASFEAPDDGFAEPANDAPPYGFEPANDVPPCGFESESPLVAVKEEKDFHFGTDLPELDPVTDLPAPECESTTGTEPDTTPKGNEKRDTANGDKETKNSGTTGCVEMYWALAVGHKNILLSHRHLGTYIRTHVVVTCHSHKNKLQL